MHVSRLLWCLKCCRDMRVYHGSCAESIILPPNLLKSCIILQYLRIRVQEQPFSVCSNGSGLCLPATPQFQPLRNPLTSISKAIL